MLGLVLPELRPGLGGEPAEVANAGLLVPLLTIVFLVPLQSSVTVENRLTVIALKPDMTQVWSPTAFYSICFLQSRIILQSGLFFGKKHKQRLRQLVN